MRKIFLLFIVLFILLFITSKSSFAARYITCDACGLCPKIDVGKGSCTVDEGVKVPGDWKSCVKCLYPVLYPANSNPNPSLCKTLAVKDDDTLMNSVKKGRQFTMLGCISSGTTAGFDDGQSDGQRGAPTFVQKLLDVIFSLAGGLAFLYLIYGGFIILSSQADPEKLNYGKRLIYGSIVGLILTLGSVFIVNLIGSGILRIPGFSGAPTP